MTESRIEAMVTVDIIAALIEREKMGKEVGRELLRQVTLSLLQVWRTQFPFLSMLLTPSPSKRGVKDSMEDFNFHWEPSIELRYCFNSCLTKKQCLVK